MNYRIELEFSLNNDEKEQHHLTAVEVAALIYESGRFVMPGTLINITHLEVDTY